MTDHPYQKLAHILVDHSAGVKKGDRVAIETTTNAAAIVGEIYQLVLQRGGFPHVLLNLPEQEKLLFTYASDEQLGYTPTFQKLTDQFEVYIRVRAEINPRGLSEVSPQKQSLRQKGMAPVRNTMLQRAATHSLRWVLTQIPTEGYAEEAGMSMADYSDFLYAACHADEHTPDPVAHWENIRKQQFRMIERIQGHDVVKLVGPNVDLSLSVKARKFNNSFGLHNMPDGEFIRTGGRIGQWLGEIYLPGDLSGSGGGGGGAKV
jgi:aminopeptidase